MQIYIVEVQPPHKNHLNEDGKIVYLLCLSKVQLHQNLAEAAYITTKYKPWMMNPRKQSFNIIFLSLFPLHFRLS